MHELDRNEEALAMYEQAQRIEPDDAQIYKARGEILVALDRYEEALKAYDTARLCDPADPDIQRLKSQVLVQMGLFAVSHLIKMNKELHN